MKCWLNVSLLSKMHPRSLNSFTTSTCFFSLNIFSGKIHFFILPEVIYINFVLDQFIKRFLFFIQLLFFSNFKLNWDTTLIKSESECHNVVSSANRIIFKSESIPKSLMKIINGCWPNIEPCGTSYSTRIWNSKTFCSSFLQSYIYLRNNWSWAIKPFYQNHNEIIFIVITLTWLDQMLSKNLWIVTELFSLVRTLVSRYQEYFVMLFHNCVLFEIRVVNVKKSFYSKNLVICPARGLSIILANSESNCREIISIIPL